MMWYLVVIGLQELRTLFGTYEQFLTVFAMFFLALMLVNHYGTAPQEAYCLNHKEQYRSTGCTGQLKGC